MSDNTGIEWTDATSIVDRAGQRTRVYRRVNATSPGVQMRRQMMPKKLKWCRRCRQWLSADSVSNNGLCRPHENADARERYATDLRYRARRKAHTYKRKRGVAMMPSEAASLIAELFDGQCAYCDQPQASWDHAEAVSKGGITEPGNMLPACISCNSSKSDDDILIWLARAPMVKPMTIEYLTHAGVL